MKIAHCRCFIGLAIVFSLSTFAGRDIAPSPKGFRAVRLVPAKRVAWAAPGSEAPENSILASYEGGTVTREEYSGWMAFKGLDLGPRPRMNTLLEIALTTTMAEAALARDVEPNIGSALDDYRSSLLEEALRRYIIDQAEVDEEQVEALYKEQPHFMDQPRKSLLYNIFKAFPQESDDAERDALRAVMADLRLRLVKGADFSQAAERESESNTRYSGGRIGFVRPGRLAREIEEVAFALKEGQISEVVETDTGLTIFKCERIAEAKTYPPDEVRSIIRDNLRRHAIETRWLAVTDRVKHAEELGLVTPDLENRLAWQRLELLAAEELERLTKNERRPVEEDEVRQVFETGGERYRTRATWELAVLHLAATTPGEIRKAQARAGQLIAEIRTGVSSFEEAARRYSDHSSAQSGGHLGWMRGVQIAAIGPRTLKVVNQLVPGEITGILQFESGLWVFKLLGHRESRPMTLDEAAQGIRSQLEQKRDRELETLVRGRIIGGLDLQVVARGGA